LEIDIMILMTILMKVLTINMIGLFVMVIKDAGKHLSDFGKGRCWNEK